MPIEPVINDITQNPKCPHGPTILYKRTTDKKEVIFYGCSTKRFRRYCPFYLVQEDFPKFLRNKQKIDIRDALNRELTRDIYHDKLYDAYQKVEKLKAAERMFCRTCCCFIFDTEHKVKNPDHEVLSILDDQQIGQPTKFLLKALTDAKQEAQYLFTTPTCVALIAMMKSLNVKNIICVGAPRIHEYIRTMESDMSSFLLDIDKRFLNFFGPHEFAWYNMFNHFFFLANSREHFKNFLLNNDGSNFALIMDPPFGGNPTLIANNLKKLVEMLRRSSAKNQNAIADEWPLPTFWIFPYFMEDKIQEVLPQFRMLDYLVDYDNKKAFTKRKFGSPIRIFTNVNPSEVRFPSIGYKLCKLCQKMVYEANRHCERCNACTGKNGAAYRHCTQCNICVKPSWIHCDECDRCQLPQHECVPQIQICGLCGKEGHLKRDCPDRRGICYNCDKLGHMRADCPEPPKKRERLLKKHERRRFQREQFDD